MASGTDRILNVGRRACAWALFNWLVLRSNLAVTFVSSKTDSNDVSALNVMYSGMNSPSQLDGWKSSGGDPCDDFWKGISCSGSKVTEIELLVAVSLCIHSLWVHVHGSDLSGLELTGSLGYKLSELTSVTYFDLSKNKFKGNIPYQLPPNVERIDLSKNEFDGNVPYSISQMTRLKEIDLHGNKLNGQLSDMFGKLSQLTEMDLSFNSLSGDLPQSFKNLTSLSTLTYCKFMVFVGLKFCRSTCRHLQNNQFTGSIDVLANLPLDDLNIGNNKFTGWIPDQLKSIKNLKTGGNDWSSGPAPPPPPGQTSVRSDKSSAGLSGAAIAVIVMGVFIVLGFIITLFSRTRSSPPPSHFLEEDTLSQQRPFAPLSSGDSPAAAAESRIDFRELESFKSSSSFKVKSFRLKPPQSDHHLKSLNNNENCTNDHMINVVKRSSSVHVASYSLADLQTATANFAMGRLLGEGSIGRVYRAKYADGKVFAVKKIVSSVFQGAQEFAEIVSDISKLRHPNICELIGYCSEQGHNMLVYDYFRNGSLHEFLHLSDDFSKPLTWNTRVRIALGTAQALEYLHEVCSPPCVHKNISSSNILLDTGLNPHLSDCSLSILHERKMQKLGTSGYNAPECTEAFANCNLKSDVYSFGVVMLELMTGRMPFDSQKSKSEQCLVRWASPQLHDIDALEKMADPALHGLYPPKSLSRFADVIALCVQAEPEFRPPMSQVVQALVPLLVQPTNTNQLTTAKSDHLEYRPTDHEKDGDDDSDSDY
ncbi:Serine/threonine protein kinase [Handroanthus impetiginosus]|uniref:Serine/threonine protein kinase n=1 Tax=Handroanthus impetiginosus TaxID=429701 RepID=A0A2G9I280_9LAMI|nr:Serine/threonine protein kinase [Handroanthus impetiginosus]